MARCMHAPPNTASACSRLQEEADSFTFYMLLVHPARKLDVSLTCKIWTVVGSNGYHSRVTLDIGINSAGSLLLVWLLHFHLAAVLIKMK